MYTVHTQYMHIYALLFIIYFYDIDSIFLRKYLGFCYYLNILNIPMLDSVLKPLKA